MPAKLDTLISLLLSLKYVGPLIEDLELVQNMSLIFEPKMSQKCFFWDKVNFFPLKTVLKVCSSRQTSQYDKTA